MFIYFLSSSPPTYPPVITFIERSMWSMLHLLPDVGSSTSTERKKLVQYRLQDLDNSSGTYHPKQVTTCQGIVCTLHYFFLITSSKPCNM